MQTETVSFEGRSVEVIPPAVHQHGDDVCEVRVESEYTLTVRFFDGVAGKVHMRGLIFSDEAGVFTALRDPAAFREVGIGLGAVTWANGLDLAPDAMHDELERNGTWVLR